MSPFLDADQLRELTGYVKPSKQIEWLTRNGITHHVNAAGRPVVMAAAVLNKSTVTAFELGPVR